jgi:hypothetical protein
MKIPGPAVRVMKKRLGGTGNAKTSFTGEEALYKIYEFMIRLRGFMLLRPVAA